MRGDLANGQDLLDTVGSEANIGREEVDSLVLEERALDEGWLDDVLDALGGLQQALGEPGTSHGHREGGRSGAGLGLYNLVAAELDAVDESVKLLAGDVWVVGLGDQGDNSDAGVAADDGDVLVRRVSALDFRDKAGGADDVKGGDAKQALGVVDVPGFEDLGDDWDSGVDLRRTEIRLNFPKRSIIRVG